MPAKLEAKLKKAYPNNPHAVYGTLNKLGLMKGSRETAKGKALDKKSGRTPTGKRKWHYYNTKVK